MKKTISSDEAINLINLLISESNTPVTVAIDGKSGSGKTTLAHKLSEIFSCNIIHADDFFLRKEQRTPERLSVPGGNFDIERFNEEISEGLKSGNDFYFSPFDCKTMSLSERVLVKKNRLTVIEGAYCTHPDVDIAYSLKLFKDISPEIQKKRILDRNKENADMFFSRWIPMEEKYFDYFDIKNSCDYIISDEK